MIFDIIFIGYGAVVEFLASNFVARGKRVLIVSNHYVGQLENFNYQEFIKVSSKIQRKLIIVGTSTFQLSKDERGLFSQLIFEGLISSDKVIHLSSVSVYPDVDIFSNEESSTLPSREYGLRKLEDEYLLREKSFFSLMTLRISNLYGAFKVSTLETNIINSIKNDLILQVQEMEVFRDFVLIDDLFFFLLRLVDAVNFNGVYNFSTGNSISIQEFVSIWVELAASKVRIETLRNSDVVQFSWINSDKIKEEYGIEFTGIKKGITESVLRQI